MCFTGHHGTLYKAEDEVILKAAKLIEDAPEDCSKVVILTGAVSVLRAFTNSKLSDMTRAVSNTSQITAVFSGYQHTVVYPEMKGLTF